ncbi:MAG: SRPBCC family protein [Planctomycetes bacterium]|nr:SRPBCC family protein [Planctomycetota bacterium]
MSSNVTVIQSIYVNAPPERVFDATEDWAKRAEWDATVLAAEMLEPADAAAQRGPLVRWGLRRSTLRAMRRAKALVERAARG